MITFSEFFLLVHRKVFFQICYFHLHNAEILDISSSFLIFLRGWLIFNMPHVKRELLTSSSTYITLITFICLLI